MIKLLKLQDQIFLYQHFILIILLNLIENLLQQAFNPFILLNLSLCFFWLKLHKKYQNLKLLLSNLLIIILIVFLKLPHHNFDHFAKFLHTFLIIIFEFHHFYAEYEILYIMSQVQDLRGRKPLQLIIDGVMVSTLKVWVDVFGVWIDSENF